MCGIRRCRREVPMRTGRWRRLATAGLLLVPALLPTRSASASGQAAEPRAAAGPRADALDLILEELRQLRRTVELTALLQVKVQVAAERLRVREPRVKALSDQAAQIEQLAMASAVDGERARAELAQVEEKIAQETAPDARRELVAQRRALADTIGHLSAQDEENQRQAAAVAESLAAERAEVDRLLEVLAGLEKTLERHVQGAGSERAP